jgi:hypothetical protein
MSTGAPLQAALVRHSFISFSLSFLLVLVQVGCGTSTHTLRFPIRPKVLAHR